jgi:zinc transport system substrate-binding protein
MKINSTVKFIFFLITIIPCVACGCNQLSARAEDRINVITTIMPLAYFIEAIGGNRVAVTIMVPPGANPHTYEPMPAQMRALGNADLYVKTGSGVEFELAWGDKIEGLNKAMIICDASKGIKLISAEGHYCAEESVDRRHYHKGADPHIWLSPDNAILMSGNIRNALIQFDPEGREFYVRNFSALAINIDKLKREIRDMLSGIENRKFLVFHPAWGYFADDFGLTQISAEYSGKEPTPRQLKALIKQARQEDIKVVFASPQFSQKISNVIAGEIGGRVVMIDPLSGDYINNLRETAEAFIESKT